MANIVQVSTEQANASNSKLKANLQETKSKISNLQKTVEATAQWWEGETAQAFIASFQAGVSVFNKYLDKIQQQMYDAALENRESKTSSATTYEEFCNVFVDKGGFVKAMWCGDEACELKIKEDTTATSRCIPFEQEHISDTCICCGKKADKMVYWGKAY